MAPNPLFAAGDGSNCPSLPQAERASHSLLIDHGLIRISRPWPPRDPSGKPIAADFTVEVVRDPSTCNLDPKYGLKSADPHISVFRRPRPVANFKYIEAMGFAYDPKAGMPLPVDPETGKPVSGNLMADARVPSLSAQMRDAAGAHLGFLKNLDKATLPASSISSGASMSRSKWTPRAGRSTRSRRWAAPGRCKSPPPAGSAATAASRCGASSKPGRKRPSPVKAKWSPEVRAFRKSVARGARAFRERTFLISDSAGINSPVGFGNPVRNSCAFCHNMSYMGMDVAPGQVDLGTTNQPSPIPRRICRCSASPAWASRIRITAGHPDQRSGFRADHRQMLGRRADHAAIAARHERPRALFLQRQREGSARGDRLLRPALFDRLFRAGEGRSGQSDARPMIRELAFAAAATATLASDARQQLSLVACPVYRDTDAGRKSGCWLAADPATGTRYDVTSAPTKPDWNHAVLVEGRIDEKAGDPCGGVVLDPVRVSVLEANCTPLRDPRGGVQGPPLRLARAQCPAALRCSQASR
jgi:hypothetical protein